MKPPEKRGPGRPRTVPDGTMPASVKLTPVEREWLQRHYGSVNAGVRAAVAALMSARK